MEVAWYYRTGFVLTLLFVVGPLALPLVWLSPALSRLTKWLTTVLMVILSLLIYKVWIDISPIIQVLLKSVPS
ncbi:hypothetical protein [Vibrio navarrensis]|uniref:hypothetical protein n=1 Tax=Vibrio navarrensis TaxID=29495 RepID=UPI00186AB13B|nr:hypothetical protein [Vibrio navarrensis]